MSIQVQKGQKVDITKSNPILETISVKISWEIPSANVNEFDINATAFLLGASGKAARDEDVVFYNNPSGGNGAIQHKGTGTKGSEEITIKLKQVPALMEKIAFTITMHDAETKKQSFRQVANLSVRVFDDKTKGELLAYVVNGAFTVETAIVAAEVYRHNGEWKFSAVGSGFEGGLRALCENFGICVEEPASINESKTDTKHTATPVESIKAEQPHQASMKSTVNLSKIDLLKKKVDIVLEKKKLVGTMARVALVLDISGSMHALYKRGTVQNVVDRIAAVAARFDDDGNLDMWMFDHRFHRLPPVNERNYENYINREILDQYKQGVFGGKIFGANDEPPVMRDVIGFYTKENKSKLPAFIVFISDGGVHKNAEIKKLMIEASTQPLFWQFIGIGKASYGILEKLDTMPGRLVDNANFFSLDDIDRISDEELYEKLLNEFPAWLVEAKSKRIL